MKKILAMIVAVCLMMSLAIPAYATGETTGAAETTSAATEATSATDATAAVDDETDVTVAGEEPGEEITDETEEEVEEDSAFIKVLRVILTVLEVITSVALIVVVLLQSGKEAGLSGVLSGNSDSYLNRNGKGSMDKVLAKATKWVALVWLLLTLALNLI